MTTYRLRQLATLLKTGHAILRGKVSGGHRWPDQPHYWIIDDCRTQQTYHVAVTDRPTWGHYQVTP